MILPAAGKGLKQTKYPGSKNFVEFPRVALTERSVKETIACVAGFKREGEGEGEGGIWARERVGRVREKGKERLQGRHRFLHFSRSDSER